MADFKLASTAEERNEAFRIAASIFDKDNTDNGLKKLAWQQEGLGNKGSVVLALNEGNIVGVARLCPARMFWQERQFSVVGLTSICILPDYRGFGLGKALMQWTLHHCDEAGFDFSYLIARRLADHF